MFMNNLKRFAPILMFVAVLGLCGWLVSSYYIDPDKEEGVLNAEASRKIVETKLAAGKVTDDYTYSVPQAAKLKYAETVKHNVDRLNNTKDDRIDVNITFPVPSRPKSEKKREEPDAIHRYAEMGYLIDQPYDKDNQASNAFRVEADRGRVYIRCELPKPDTFKYMEPVRIEIYRGLAGNKIDMNKPWGTIELGLENSNAAKGAAGGATPVTVAQPAEEPVNSRKARMAGGGGATAPAGKDKPAPVFQLPAVERVFRDTTDIVQQTEYFYQARLICRFTLFEGKTEINQKPDKTTETIIYHAPNDKNLLPAKSPNPASTAKLFASPLTHVASAITPTNFDLRFSGVNGQVPTIGYVRDPKNHDNKNFTINFELRVWLGDLNEWKTVQLQNIAEGDTIGGKVVYTPKGGEKKEYDYTKDLAYKLYEVNNEEVDSTIKGQKEVKEVALLENQRTKKLERILKRGPNPVIKDSVKTFDRIIEAQDREYKKLKDAPAAPGAAAPAPAAPAVPPVK